MIFIRLIVTEGFIMRACLILLLSLFTLAGNAKAYAMQAKELYAVCKPYHLRGFEGQHTTSKVDDLASANGDLLCVSVVKVIIDFSSQLCLQAFYDKSKKSEVKNLIYYMTSSEVTVHSAINAFVTRYKPESGDASAHLQVLKAVNHSSVYSQCKVLK